MESTMISIDLRESRGRHRCLGAAACSALLLVVMLAILGSVTYLHPSVPWAPWLRRKFLPYPSDPVLRAQAFLADHPVVDGHNDLPVQYRGKANTVVETDALDISKDLTGIIQTDIPRAAIGGLGGQFWAAYVSCSFQHKGAVRATLEQIDIIHRFVEKYHNTFQFARTSSDISTILGAGKFPSLIGIEGGHSIDSSLMALRQFHALGVRYLTLTHNCDTPWSTYHASPDAATRGLTDFGRQIVRGMNHMGMFVDISHVGVKTMNDALDTSLAPVIFSHSSSYTICPNTRNVPDQVLDRLPANDSLIMINFARGFLCDKPTLEGVADHIDYVARRIGSSHVGLGADYDGAAQPDGLEDVSKYKDLIAELFRRGFTDAEVTGITHGNLLRVMKKMEDVAATLQSQPPNYSVLSVSNNCRRDDLKTVLDPRDMSS